jgi:phosphoribosylglycinamide formyltransferase-1
MIPIVVFASGRGTNFNAIQKSIERKELKAQIVAVVSDKPDALVLSKARDFGIPAVVVPVSKVSPHYLGEERRRVHEELILQELEQFRPRFLVMGGYMRILTHRLIEAFRSEKGYSRIVNIHPSLLPSFPGIHSYAQAFRYGVKVTGVTVHFVEKEVDAGPICAQETFSIADCQNEAEVEERGLVVEHRLLPQTLSWILTENFTLVSRSEGRFCVRPN